MFISFGSQTKVTWNFQVQGWATQWTCRQGRAAFEVGLEAGGRTRKRTRSGSLALLGIPEKTSRARVVFFSEKRGDGSELRFSWLLVVLCNQLKEGHPRFRLAAKWLSAPCNLEGAKVGGSPS